MKAICDRGALVEALNLVSGVVVSRTPKPVLTCVKLEADGNTLTLSATDLEASMRVSTERVDVQEAGATLVPADKFSQIVRESVDPTLTIETEGEATHVRGEDSHFKVYGYPVSEFPPLPQFEGDADFEITTDALSQLIHQTIYATARENSRYAINGVLLEQDGNKVTVVATDGHRLAMSKGDCKGSKGSTKTAIVPTKALQQLIKILSDDDQPVKVKAADNQIMFETADALLTTNLVEGNFPPYKDVIPKDGDKKATLDTGSLQSGMRRAALLTNEESKGVKMSFSKSGLTLSSRAPELGEAEIDIDLPGFDGEPIDIGFNPYYLLDALKVIPNEQVTLDMKAPNKPGVLKTGSNFLYVVMPVNLQ